MVKQPRHETSSHQQDDVSAGWILEEWFSGLEVDVDGWAKDQGPRDHAIFIYFYWGQSTS